MFAYLCKSFRSMVMSSRPPEFPDPYRKHLVCPIGPHGNAPCRGDCPCAPFSTSLGATRVVARERGIKRVGGSFEWAVTWRLLLKTRALMCVCYVTKYKRCRQPRCRAMSLGMSHDVDDGKHAFTRVGPVSGRLGGTFGRRARLLRDQFLLRPLSPLFHLT